MSDEAREYLRAAQAAEIRGDKVQAVELLRKAAALYRGRGNPARALQMLRQARRLDINAAEVDDEIRRLDWTLEDPLRRAAGAEDDAETERALAPLDEAANPKPKRLIERVPVKADPSLNAWCSFCCNPTKDVGDLVAGPAGAFICANCLGTAGRILGVEPNLRAVPTPSSDVDLSDDASGDALVDALIGERPEDAPALEFLGQPEALHVLDAAMRIRAPVVLLLGPEGCGKTAYLRHLAAQGFGQYVARREDLEPGSDQRLLLDATPELLADEAVQTQIETTGAIIAMRGEAIPQAALTIASDGLELPLVASADLVGATGGKLPLQLADKVNVVAAFRPLTTEELEEITRRLLLTRMGDVEASEELISAISTLAARSGRGGHEARALVGRLPNGTWSLGRPRQPEPASDASPAAAKASARKSRRKKGDEGA